MEKDGDDKGDSQPMQPPPPVIPPSIKPERADRTQRTIISRPGFGKSGRPISLLTNYFRVSLKHPDEIFYQYSVGLPLTVIAFPFETHFLLHQIYCVTIYSGFY